MPLLDNATLVPGAGNYFYAPYTTPAEAVPTDLTVVEGNWDNIGHTSIEEILGLASEGGEATVLATLQNSSLRTTYSARTETLTFTLQQFDEDSLRLYFGSNMVDVGDGTTTPLMLGVPTNPQPTLGSFLAVFIDGMNHFGLYVPKAEFFRNEDWSMADNSSLAGLPLGVKPMQDGSNTWTYAVTPLGVTP